MCSEVVYKQLLVMGVSQDPLHGSLEGGRDVASKCILGHHQFTTGVRVFASGISEMPVIHQDCWGTQGLLERSLTDGKEKRVERVVERMGLPCVYTVENQWCVCRWCHLSLGPHWQL